jgi:hypothetical protein
MVKNSFYILFFWLLMTVAATAGYVEGPVTLSDSEAELTFYLSNNISLNYLYATDGLGYVLGTYHTSGSRTYGSSSGDTYIFWVDETAGTLPAAPTGAETAGFSWTSL